MKSNKYSDKKIKAELVNEVEKCYYLIIDKLNKEEILFEDHVLMNLTKNYIEKIQTIIDLSYLGRGESISILTRASIETYVSIIHILNGDTEKLATSYYLNQKIQVIRTIIRSSDSEIILKPEELNQLQKISSSINSYKDYLKYYEDKWFSLFEANPNKIAEYKRKWYSLDWKIKSFTQLMQHIGIKKNIVNFYYGLTSIDVHGMSGIVIIEENIMTWCMYPNKVDTFFGILLNK